MTSFEQEKSHESTTLDFRLKFLMLFQFQNFSVCEDCSKLCQLYHNLHHQKQKLYVMCSEIVEKRKTTCPGIDTTQILNQLLADDSWLETVIKLNHYLF